MLLAKTQLELETGLEEAGKLTKNYATNLKVESGSIDYCESGGFTAFPDVTLPYMEQYSAGDNKKCNDRAGQGREWKYQVDASNSPPTAYSGSEPLTNGANSPQLEFKGCLKQCATDSNCKAVVYHFGIANKFCIGCTELTDITVAHSGTKAWKKMEVAANSAFVTSSDKIVAFPQAALKYMVRKEDKNNLKCETNRLWKYEESSSLATQLAQVQREQDCIDKCKHSNCEAVVYDSSIAPNPYCMGCTSWDSISALQVGAKVWKKMEATADTAIKNYSCP